LVGFLLHLPGASAESGRRGSFISRSQQLRLPSRYFGEGVLGMTGIVVAAAVLLGTAIVMLVVAGRS
jgi:hypothetical protein